MPMPLASFFNDELNCGLYIGSHEEAARCRTLRISMSPGVVSDRAGGDWPHASELGGRPQGVTVNWVHFPYTPPGEVFVGSDIVLRFHDGDWREAAGIYREWFGEHFPVADSRGSWLRKETATQDTMFLLPEGNVNFRFKDISGWARDAKGRGVSAVLIIGFNVGGHDRGYPEYSPDPRLGTWEELEAGIAAC